MAKPTSFFDALFTSDQVYGLGTEQIETSYTDLDGTSHIQDLEYAELKDEYNHNSFASSSYSVWKETPEGPKHAVADRIIYTGSLTFSGTRLKGARIDKIIQWSSFLDWNQNIITVTTLPRGFEISDTSSKEQWLALDRAISTSGSVTFRYDDVSWDLTTQTPPFNATTVADFLALPEAQYFESDWARNPTAANVLADIDLKDTPITGEAQPIKENEVDLSTSISGPSAKQDDLIGTSSDDTLAAGKGVDKLTGGEGADKFIFNTPDKFGKKGADIITDFNKAQGDQIFFSTNALPGLRANQSFVIATSKKALKAAQKSAATLIYYKPLGQLFYDQNGSGRGFGKGGLFAILSGAPELTANDLGLLG